MVGHRCSDLEVLEVEDLPELPLRLGRVRDRRPRRGHRLPGHAADRGQVPDETTVSDLPDNEICSIVAEVGQGDTDLTGEKVIALQRPR